MNYFWAKTTADGAPGISVYEHMINVGCVARCIAEAAPELLKRFGLLSSLVGALAALHDLGKISPGFQQKCEQWLIANHLATAAKNGNWVGGTETDHGRASHAAIQDFLLEVGCARNAAMHIATVLGAHHGRIKFRPEPRGIRPPLIAPLSEERSGIDWQAERLLCAGKVWDYFGVQEAPAGLTEDAVAIWWLAGLTTVADWIGSDERFFSPIAESNDSDPLVCAKEAIGAIGLIPPAIVPGLSFEQLFDFTPNDMQAKTLAAITGPGVYVIEAPMGMGKTEAALGAAYQLLAAGKASGIYFALPTQATSNRIHLRLNEFLNRIAPTSGASRLIHGNSWLMNSEFREYQPARNASEKTENDARSGRDWFASTKRALLAPFGVGTVDQALLGVVAAKHFFVRHFALAGKVVIIDEVHSYDVYTGALVDILIKMLERLGCTVIILSATLTGKRRTQILANSEDSNTPETQSYPLITGRTEQSPFPPVSATPPASKKIMLEFVKPDTALDDAIAVASAGGTVIWICNTVDAAQQQFLRLQQQAGSRFKLGLLHARMIFSHREKREEEWMQRLGKDGANRGGSILVSTQVVEQSVDLDADLLITELAPTDMLLQRLGRLWRHEREGRPVAAPRVCVIEEEKMLGELLEMPPKATVSALGGKARVYAPYVLLRTLEVWQKQTDGITIPGQIRELIEQTYCDRDDEPESWQQLYNEWFGTDSAKKFKAQMSTNIWQPALNDQEGVQTRLNELPTISLILCMEHSKDHAHCVDGSIAHFNGEFSYETARALHRNLVRMSLHHFKPLSGKGPFGEYLHEAHVVGIVGADGMVQVDGLKDGISLRYTEELGLVVNKSR
ncbi:CRISPR-associated helicase Cas3' [Thiovibrio sp. JS02]